MNPLIEPKNGWKTWFNEKAENLEITKEMKKTKYIASVKTRGEIEKIHADKIQEKLDKFFKDLTSLKMRLDYAKQNKKAYDTKVASLSAVATPELKGITDKLGNLRKEIKTAKKHLDSTTDKIASELNKIFEFPDFSKMDLCNNSFITISAKNELDWDFDGTNGISTECFTKNKEQIKKAITPWVNKQFDMGKLELQGIITKRKLKVKAILKKNRTRG